MFCLVDVPQDETLLRQRVSVGGPSATGGRPPRPSQVLGRHGPRGRRGKHAHRPRLPAAALTDWRTLRPGVRTDHAYRRLHYPTGGPSDPAYGQTTLTGGCTNRLADPQTRRTDRPRLPATALTDWRTLRPGVRTDHAYRRLH